MNIYKRKDGRYEGRITVDRAAGGKGYLSFYGKTAQETEEKMSNYINRLKAALPSSSLTVEKLFCQWIAAISIRLKESSLAVYRMRIESHILPRLGRLGTDELTAPLMQKFISDKLAEGLTANYVSDIISTLRSMLRFGARQYGIRDTLEDIILPRKRRPQVRLLSSTQQLQLGTRLMQDKSLTALGISLTLSTGLRLGELCALRWEDIDLEEKTLSVNRIIQRIRNPKGSGTHLTITAPKSASSQRVIPLPDWAVQQLSSREKEGRCYLLTGTDKPIEPRTMQYRFQSVLKKEKLPSVHFHALRHMFATRCVELGLDIKSLSEILGHSRVEITLNSYVHSSMERKKAFMQSLSLTLQNPAGAVRVS